MNRRHYLSTAAVALCAALAGHALYGALASARAAVRPRDGGWEYCAVVKAQTPGSLRLVYWIVNFKGEGVKIEPVEGMGVAANSFGKAVAKLGDEGWEMVGAERLLFQTAQGLASSVKAKGKGRKAKAEK